MVYNPLIVYLRILLVQVDERNNMFEAIVTLVVPKGGDAGRPDDSYTKVYRLEFESLDNFLDWRGEGDRFAVNTEELSA
jgi:hypothetical protein